MKHTNNCSLSTANDTNTSAVNLRESSAGLTPVGNPRDTAACHGTWLLSHTDDQNLVHNFFFNTDGNLIVVTPDRSSHTIGHFDTPPLQAISSGRGVIIVTDEGPWHVWPDGNGSWTPAGNPCFTPLTFTTIAERDFTIATDPLALHGEYPHWRGPLTADDLLIIGRHFSRAYTRLVDTVRQSGYCPQPVAAAYRLIDADGLELFRSVPVVISADGWQLTTPVGTPVASSGGLYNRLDGVALTARAFRPAIILAADTAPDSVWNHRVHTLEILASPVIHPFDLDSPCRCSFGAASATGAVLDVSLPLLDSPATLAEEVVTRFFDMATVVSVISSPFSGSLAQATPVAWQTSPVTSPETSARCISRARSRVIPDPGPGMADCTGPHCFGASALLEAGDIVLWGDLRAVHSRPWPLPMIAASSDSSMAWQGEISVSLPSSGEVLVWRGGGSGNAPLALWPVVSYPHAGATSMSVNVALADGSSRGITLSLHRRGTTALYADPHMKPIMLAGLPRKPDPVTMRRAAPAFPGYVGVARTASPSAIIGMLRAGIGTVKAIEPAVRSSSAWDFARRHFYVFTTSGIHSLVVNSSALPVSTHLIDRRGVASRAAVTRKPGAVFALAGGDLVRVRGSDVDGILSRTDAFEVGWSAPYGELWLLHPSRAVTIINPATRAAYTRTFTADALITMHGRLWAIASQRIFDTSVEHQPPFQHIAWRRRIPSPPGQLLAAEWQLSGGVDGIALSVGADNARPPAFIYHRLILRGDIRAHPAIATAMPPARFITIAVEGPAAPDFTLVRTRYIASPPPH